MVANGQRSDEHDADVLPALQALYEGKVAEAESLLPSDDRLRLPEAAAFGRLERMKALLEDDAALVNDYSSDGFTALHLAIFGGRAEAVSLLVQRAADVNVMSRHATIRVRPLGTAAFVQRADLARLLLDNDADPNATGEGGFTPLHSAAHNGDAELVRLLLERGADPAVATDDGRTAADIAREAGHVDLVAELER